MCFVLDWKIGLEASYLDFVLSHQSVGHPFISIPNLENRDCKQISFVAA